MRVTIGAVAVLGLAVTVAAAQPGKERAAALKAPEPLAAGELPPVARGAVDDVPLSSTPVPRSNSPAARAAANPGPAWLTGADPNVLPVAGTATKAVSVRPPTPTPTTLTKDESPVPPPPKMLDRLRPFSNEKPTATPAPHPIMQTPPAPMVQQPQPTASTPFRGTGVNGAPVFAGPPAYRWYGWGTVTPGANPLAPAGQYPKASANWYSITGATPGAFPVPVTNPVQIAPGTEPPTYGLAARTPAPVTVVPIASQPQPAPTFVERPVERQVERLDVPKFHPQPESKFAPGPSAAVPPPAFGPPSMPVSVPTLTPPPIPKPATVAAPPVLPPPSMPLPPAPPAHVVAAPPALPAPPAAPPVPPAVPRPEPVAALPPMPPVPALPPVSPAPSVAPAPLVAPVPPVVPVPAAEPVKITVDPKLISTVPAPLPTSVTAEPARNESKWQQSSEPTAPRPGTWAPATNAVPLPTVPVEQPPSWETGAAPVKPVVARGQSSDDTDDPVVNLIKQICEGRATSVEVRWTGTKKLSVCFEIRGSEAAQKLVADISKRPELTAYQIDFCVLVK